MSKFVFNKLSAEARSLVAIAVLLDGVDAGFYLEDDFQNGEEFKKAAEDLCTTELEYRLPLVGTLLREAIQELGSE